MAAAPQVKPGDVLANGKYRVERVLGAGGMGMVVAARHVELGQRVALKFMLKDAMAEVDGRGPRLGRRRERGGRRRLLRGLSLRSGRAEVGDRPRRPARGRENGLSLVGTF